MRRRFMPIGISPNNVIRYTTSDGSLVSLYRNDFGTTIVDHSYGILRFNSNVLYIGTSAFKGCSSLTSIEIPNSVTSIGWYAFEGCSSLTSIVIPNSVTSIGWYAFYECKSLTSVYIKSTTPPTLGDTVFNNNASNRKIYVPRASVDAYKTASGWSKYADAIEPYDY